MPRRRPLHPHRHHRRHRRRILPLPHPRQPLGGAGRCGADPAVHRRLSDARLPPLARVRLAVGDRRRPRLRPAQRRRSSPLAGDRWRLGRARRLSAGITGTPDLRRPARPPTPSSGPTSCRRQRPVRPFACRALPRSAAMPAGADRDPFPVASAERRTALRADADDAPLRSRGTTGETQGTKSG